MKFWLARIGEAMLTLWLLATLCFFLLRAAPGGLAIPPPPLRARLT